MAPPARKRVKGETSRTNFADVIATIVREEEQKKGDIDPQTKHEIASIANEYIDKYLAAVNAVVERTGHNNIVLDAMTQFIEYKRDSLAGKKVVTTESAEDVDDFDEVVDSTGEDETEAWMKMSQTPASSQRKFKATPRAHSTHKQEEEDIEEESPVTTATKRKADSARRLRSTTKSKN